ncbi:hypothetical protein, partial [Klebsiella pneumoniae]|uniref:hypothetical protein n=1 Tax=Klebsiella pneumoniae TaxID=573 RepID=UPI0024DE792B
QAEPQGTHPLKPTLNGRVTLETFFFFHFFPQTPEISNHIKGKVIRATFLYNLSRDNVALQVVEIVCCAYYHLRAHQIF